jgi:hypothetical protein
MLIDGVVHHLKHAVVKAALVRIANVHSWAEADSFEAFEMLDLLGTIGLVGSYMGGAVEVVVVV